MGMLRCDAREHRRRCTQQQKTPPAASCPYWHGKADGTRPRREQDAPMSRVLPVQRLRSCICKSLEDHRFPHKGRVCQIIMCEACNTIKSCIAQAIIVWRCVSLRYIRSCSSQFYPCDSCCKVRMHGNTDEAVRKQQKTPPCNVRALKQCRTGAPTKLYAWAGNAAGYQLLVLARDGTGGDPCLLLCLPQYAFFIRTMRSFLKDHNHLNSAVLNIWIFRKK